MNIRTLRRITEIPCKCPTCGWQGVTGDCKTDVDGDGNLGCPECIEEKLTVVVEQHFDTDSVYLGVVE